MIAKTKLAARTVKQLACRSTRSARAACQDREKDLSLLRVFEAASQVMFRCSRTYRPPTSGTIADRTEVFHEGVLPPDVAQTEASARAASRAALGARELSLSVAVVADVGA